MGVSHGKFLTEKFRAKLKILSLKILVSKVEPIASKLLDPKASPEKVV